MKVIELYSRRAHIALACKWRFPRTEIRGNFLAFHSKNLIHFRRELVNQTSWVFSRRYFELTHEVDASLPQCALAEDSDKPPEKESPRAFQCSKNHPTLLQKSSRMSWYRQRVRVWAGKFTSINSWFLFVLWGWAKSCSNIICWLLLKSFRLWIGNPFDFCRFSISGEMSWGKIWYQNVLGNDLFQDLSLINFPVDIAFEMYQGSGSKRAVTKPNHPFPRKLVTLHSFDVIFAPSTDSVVLRVEIPINCPNFFICD